MRPATRRICAKKGDGEVIQWGKWWFNGGLMGFNVIQWGIPSGKLTFCYGKSPFFMGKSTISMPFSLAMFVYQRV